MTTAAIDSTKVMSTPVTATPSHVPHADRGHQQGRDRRGRRRCRTEPRGARHARREHQIEAVELLVLPQAGDPGHRVDADDRDTGGIHRRHEADRRAQRREAELLHQLGDVGVVGDEVDERLRDRSEDEPEREKSEPPPEQTTDALRATRNRADCAGAGGARWLCPVSRMIPSSVSRRRSSATATANRIERCEDERNQRQEVVRRRTPPGSPPSRAGSPSAATALSFVPSATMRITYETPSTPPAAPDGPPPRSEQLRRHRADGDERQREQRRRRRRRARPGRRVRRPPTNDPKTASPTRTLPPPSTFT